jgi:hypothetical protein
LGFAVQLVNARFRSHGKSQKGYSVEYLVRRFGPQLHHAAEHQRME